MKFRISRGHRLCLRRIVRGIDVKKRINRLGRPIGDGNAVPGGPDFDLAQTFGNERAAQILAQRERPQSDDRVPPLPRTRAGERRAGTGAGRVQSRYEIFGQKWTIAGHADEPLASRHLQRRPIETGENAGERACEIGHAVGDDRQLGIGKARRIAIGVDHEPGALSRQASEHALQDRSAADRDSRFISAAHAARQTAGEHESESRRMCHSRKLSLPRPAAEGRNRAILLFIMHRGFAPVPCAFLGDVSEVLIENDAVLAR